MPRPQPRPGEDVFRCDHAENVYAAHVYGMPLKIKGYAWFFFCEACDASVRARNEEDTLVVFTTTATCHGQWPEGARPLTYNEDLS